MRIIKMVVTSIALWGQVIVAVCSWSERFALRTAIIFYLPTIKLLCLAFSFSNLEIVQNETGFFHGCQLSFIYQLDAT